MNRHFATRPRKRGEPHVAVRRSRRWLLDNIIRAHGIDWDKPALALSSTDLAARCQRRFFARHPRAGEEDGRHRAFVRIGCAPARGHAKAPRRPTTSQRARRTISWRLLHGARAMALRSERRTNMPTTTRSASATPSTPALADHHSRRSGCRPGQGYPGLVSTCPGYQGGRIPV